MFKVFSVVFYKKKDGGCRGILLITYTELLLSSALSVMCDVIIFYVQIKLILNKKNLKS